MTWVKRGMVRVWSGMPADDPRHGTPKGARVHRQRGETPCLSCADAERDQQRRDRARRANACEECGAPTGRTLCRSCATSEANRREFCKRGHRRIPDNLYDNGNCRACMLEQQRDKRQARAERAIVAQWCD